MGARASIHRGPAQGEEIMTSSSQTVHTQKLWSRDEMHRRLENLHALMDEAGSMRSF
jgi:hypothetical protein